MGFTQRLQLVDAARNVHTTDRSPLQRIRDSTGFHYDQKTLARGYEAHFKREARANPNAANMTAQFSLGDTMQGTRFYYADAASQRAFIDIETALPRRKKDAAGDGVVELAEQVNSAVGPVLLAFVRHRTGNPGPTTAPPG